MRRETNAYLEGKVSFTKWETAMKGLLRKAYHDAFQLGIRSSGNRTVLLNKADKAWIDSAVRDEMQYFLVLTSQVRTRSYKGNLWKRLEAYVEALKHIYYSGRVVGSPSGMLVDWVAPMDRNTCKGCRFLHEHSPYTKDRLPTTPRAGDTPCLNRCRCRLVMRQASKERLQKVRANLRTKSWYKQQLTRIKRRR
jgi:hypothetical protein